MDKRVNKIIDLIENTVDEVSLETLQSYREKRLQEPLDQRTPKKTKGIQRAYTKAMYKINKDEKGTFGDNKGYGQGRYMGDSVEDDLQEGDRSEFSANNHMSSMSQSDKKFRLIHKKTGSTRGIYNSHSEAMKAHGSHPMKSQLTVEEVDDEVEESMVARVQGGRKMVSAEAALRHAREIAHKRSPGSKPTMSDIAAAHRKLSSGVKESDELEEGLSSDLGCHTNESFVVKDPSGKTVAVKYSDGEAKKHAEELTKKTGQKHEVKFERAAVVKEDTEGKDSVTLEIPALIRALEWAREDAEDDVAIHKFVEKLINHEGTVDMGFFSEGVVPSADRKVDRNGRPYPARQVHIGTNESETLNVGDTVWAKDQKLSYKTHSGKILSISKETVTVKLKSGETQTFPKKAVSSDFEMLNPNPYKRADESIDESQFPQEAVGKSNKKIAEMLADDLKRVGIKLIKADPFPGQKGTIWSVESSQYPNQVVTLEWSARTPGGRGINKEKNIHLSFELYNKDGTRFEPTRMNKLNSIASITFDGIGKTYKERVL